MNHTTRFLILGCLFGLILSLPLCAEPREETRTNKLLYQYRFYYQPFGVIFEQGRTEDDILPFFPEKDASPSRLLTADELKTLDREWAEIRKTWTKRALLESTKVPLNQSVRISQHLISHQIPLNRNAFDRTPVGELIALRSALKSKAPEVQAAFKQILFIKSFVKPTEFEKFNFILIGASWCNSSREYRILMETLSKRFPNSEYILHSVVVDDPKEKIFESEMLKELFPHQKKYSHESVPRFLAFQVINGRTHVWEEGEALKEFYDRYFAKHQGFLNDKTTLLKGFSMPAGRNSMAGPSLSSLVK